MNSGLEMPSDLRLCTQQVWQMPAPPANTPSPCLDVVEPLHSEHVLCASHRDKGSPQALPCLILTRTLRGGWKFSLFSDEETQAPDAQVNFPGSKLVRSSGGGIPTQVGLMTKFILSDTH